MNRIILILLFSILAFQVMAQEKIVQIAGENASNEWLEPVTDEEYGKINMNSMQSNHKVLVAYFSATGVTARAAQKVAEATGGEVYAITPAKPYTDADLDWNDKQSRSSVEMNDPKARPALGGERLDVSEYDIVFIGYPSLERKEGRLLNRADEKTLRTWIERLGY